MNIPGALSTDIVRNSLDESFFPCYTTCPSQNPNTMLKPQCCHPFLSSGISLPGCWKFCKICYILFGI